MSLILETTGFEVDSRKLDKALREFPKLADHNVKVAIRKAFSKFRRAWLQQTGVKMGRGKESLGRRFVWKVTGKKVGDIVGSFFTQSDVAETLEKGATFRPKKGKYLAIPIGHALTKKGGKPKKQYRSARRVFDEKGRQKFRLIKLSTGEFLVLEIFGKGRRSKKTAQPGFGTQGLKPKQRGRPVYLLKRSVTISPKLGLRKAWDKQGPKLVRTEMEKAISATIAGRKIPGKDVPLKSQFRERK